MAIPSMSPVAGPSGQLAVPAKLQHPRAGTALSAPVAGSRFSARTALPKTEATYTWLPSGETARSIGKLIEPTTSHGDGPVSATQPVVLTRSKLPSGCRSSTWIVLLPRFATYSWSESWLGAIARGDTGAPHGKEPWAFDWSRHEP